jgi:hypothetical protein
VLAPGPPSHDVRDAGEGSGMTLQRATRGLGAATAIVIMAVIVVISGAASYVAFSQIKNQGHTVVSCAPAGNPVCSQILNVHNVGLLIPLKSTQQGDLIPFTAVPPGGGVSSFQWNFGDGTTQTTQQSVTTHAYKYPGTYIVQVSATVGGVVHDNDLALGLVTVTTSYASASSGQVPGVSGAIVANSTSNTTASAVLKPSQSVTLLGSYTAAPTDPAWTEKAPTLATPGGTVSKASNTSGSFTATVLYSNPGIYTASFVGSAVDSAGHTAYQNYTWTVFVAPTGVPARLASVAAAASPHKGSIISYENTPGGTYTSDPAIDYDIVGFEILLNVYQTLIFYNGSQTGDSYQSYVPEIATCVPSSPICSQLYGSSLVSGYNYTFVISHVPKFYDPATGASWGVYPSDVVFSLARTMGFANLPSVGTNNGWIETQSLLPAGNVKWDQSAACGGYVCHYPYNNTPQNVFASMSVNDSRWCPSIAMSQEHGCVTFHVYGGNESWPYFFQLIADGEGASIVPCGWFSAGAQGAGIPYWTQNNVSGSGDHPCLLPGGATSTSSSAFQSAVTAMPPTGWDAWEVLGSGALTGSYPGNVQNNMVGSGPYYMAHYVVGQSFNLKRNPAYAQLPECMWVTCEPAPAQMASDVSVVWESDASLGEQALASGVADYAGMPTSDYGLLLQLVQQGRAQALSIPTINIYFVPLALNFSVSAAQKLTPTPINVPGDVMSNLAFRQFLVHAYPYASIQSTINTRDGIQAGFPYGGAIPQFMGDYYPKDIAWPSGDPCTSTSNPACASYWWSQLTTSSSPYYDSLFASCSPCNLPVFSPTGNPDNDQRIADWAAEVNTLSGGKVRVFEVTLPEAQIVSEQYSAGAGSSFLSAYGIRWVPDYPDPTDYVRPLYFPDNSFTYGSAVAEQVHLGAYNATSCSAGGHDFTNYGYWASLATLPENCQGVAYDAMNYAFTLAAPMPDNVTRVQLYDLGEKIANLLGLYVYQFQQNLVPVLGPWVTPSSFNTNPIIGGGGDTPWFWITGNNVAG